MTDNYKEKYLKFWKDMYTELKVSFRNLRGSIEADTKWLVDRCVSEIPDFNNGKLRSEIDRLSVYGYLNLDDYSKNAIIASYYTMEQARKREKLYNHIEYKLSRYDYRMVNKMPISVSDIMKAIKIYNPPEDYLVVFENGFSPDRFNSWRGRYDEISLEYSRDKIVKVYDFFKHVFKYE